MWHLHRASPFHTGCVITELVLFHTRCGFTELVLFHTRCGIYIEPVLFHTGCVIIELVLFHTRCGIYTQLVLFHTRCVIIEPTLFHAGCGIITYIWQWKEPILSSCHNSYIWPWKEPILSPCQKGTTLTYDHGRNQSSHHVRRAHGLITSSWKEPQSGEHQASPWSTQTSLWPFLA